MSGRAGVVRILVALTLVIPSLFLHSTWADDAETTGAPDTRAVTFAFSVDWTTAYYFRGLLQEDGGAIVQPAGAIDIRILESRSISFFATLGTWSSFHSRRTGASSTDSFVSEWYEADLYAGLGLGIGDFAVTAQYITYASPSGAFASIDEVLLSFSYDNTSIWRDEFSLSAHLGTAFETRDRDPSPGRGSEDAYLEVGVAASYAWRLSATSFVALEVPLTVGLNVDDYYVNASGETDTVGFWDLGLDARYGLPFPARYGAWSIRASVHHLSLGSAAQELNGGDGSVVVGTVGLGLNF